MIKIIWLLRFYNTNSRSLVWPVGTYRADYRGMVVWKMGTPEITEF